MRRLSKPDQDERKAVVQEKLYQQWRAGGSLILAMTGDLKQNSFTNFGETTIRCVLNTHTHTHTHTLFMSIFLRPDSDGCKHMRRFSFRF